MQSRAEIQGRDWDKQEAQKWQRAEMRGRERTHARDAEAEGNGCVVEVVVEQQVGERNLPSEESILGVHFRSPF